MQLTGNLVWPQLRQDLELLPGAPSGDGEPSWTIHDPARNVFVRIDWLTFEILQRWGLGQPQAIAQDIADHTTLQAEPQDVLHVAEFLQLNQLTLATRAQGMPASKLAERLRQAQGSFLKWLVHNYLFVRVPLVRPDAWLTRWLPLAQVFWSRGFGWATFAALMVGAWLVMGQAQTFWGSLVDTFTWQGLLAYGVALMSVKVVHELGHAFTAKRFGCKVPTMGVAFLVMWPVAYTDINDAWRITSHRARLKISSAGILTELTVAIWATLFWALLSDGPLRSALFFLATASWVMTVLINASPFMRFDGYFILSDWLNAVNLHERSFALARWQLREWLFGLGEEAPEHLPREHQHAMVLFGLSTWVYRLLLFAGIALLVYHFFFKVLGVVLFLVEIAWFVALPIWRELQVWWTKRQGFLHKARFRRTLWLLLLALFVLLLPWPGRLELSGLLRPAQTLPLIAPAVARVDAWPVAVGQTVRAGEPLLQLSSPELQMRLDMAAERAQRAQWVASTSGLTADTAQRLQSNESEQLSAQKEQLTIQNQIELLRLKAPFTGRLVDVPADLQPGQWVARHERLGALQDTDGIWLVESWIDERDLPFVREGDEAFFIFDGQGSSPVALTVQTIERDATRVLPRTELSATLGGHVHTRVQDRQHHTDSAVYRVVFEVRSDLSAEQRQHQWRGRVQVHTAWHSPVWPYLRQVLLVLVRELAP